MLQISEKAASNKTRLNEILWIFVKLAILMTLLWYVYQTFQQQSISWISVLTQTKQTLRNQPIGLLIIVLLTLINWSLEARKWQVLVQKVQRISFSQAFEGVLMGTTLGYLTPANVGDYAGKLVHFRQDQRLATLGAAVLGNGLQFYIALFFGTMAYSCFIFTVLPDSRQAHIVLLVALWLSVGLGIVLSTFRQSIEPFFLRVKWLNAYQKFFQVIGSYSPSSLIHILLIGVIRYQVFSLQFLIMLKLFAISLNFSQLLMVIALVFLAKTVIPAFSFLSDLGVREFSALYFFQFYGIAPHLVVAATLSLWLINILLPMLVGAWFLLRFRFRKI